MGFALGVGLIILLALAFAGVARGWLLDAGGDRCPVCARGRVRWTFARKDGGRDQRYSFNPQFCPACGWSTVAELDESVDPALTLTVSAGGAAVVPVAVRTPSRAFGQTPEESHLIAAALERIARQSGPAARRDALDNALADVRSADGRAALIEPASRIEVHTVVSQAKKLPPGRREKKIEDALERLLADPYDDALQHEAIALLRRILADERAPLPDTSQLVG
jgi:hypothetical protein